MPNWIAIDEDLIRTGKSSEALDAVKDKAAEREETDPLPEFIVEVVAQIRAAVRSGNTLDVDSTKVPAALKGLAVRMILRRIYSYIEAPLSEDDRSQAREDASYLNRVIDAKLKFDAADNPDTGRGPWIPGMWNSENKIVGRTHPVPAPGLQTPARGYANPDAPTDNSQ